MRTSGFSTSSKPTANRSKGFTLIEILVTLSILGVLSGVLIGYAAESSRQTFMMITRERVIRLMARTKSLSTSTFLDNVSTLSDPNAPKTCGYGLHIDRTTGEIFIFRDINTNCANADYIYTPTADARLTGSLDSYSLDLNRISFITDPAGELNNVVFVPPNPDVHINGDTTGSVTQAGVNLRIKDGSAATAEISINNAGQISWK